MRSSRPMSIIALDVGDARIGVARANSLAKLPEPVGIITNDIHAKTAIESVIKEHAAELLVVGLPLLVGGKDSDQAQKVRMFTNELAKHLTIDYVFVDESHSSSEADDWLKRHKRGIAMHNDDIAACIILQRYLEDVE